jgi:hypothetical protein
MRMSGRPRARLIIGCWLLTLVGCGPISTMAPYSAVLQGQESAYYRPPVYYYPPPQRVGPMPGFAPWSSSPQMRCVQLGPYLQCH